MRAIEKFSYSDESAGPSSAKKAIRAIPGRDVSVDSDRKIFHLNTHSAIVPSRNPRDAR
jgi:hypothetical protein